MKYYVVYGGEVRQFGDCCHKTRVLGDSAKRVDLEKKWVDTDAVLFEYDISEEGELVNGRQIKDFSVSIS